MDNANVGMYIMKTILAAAGWPFFILPAFLTILVKVYMYLRLPLEGKLSAKLTDEVALVQKFTSKGVMDGFRETGRMEGERLASEITAMGSRVPA